MSYNYNALNKIRRVLITVAALFLAISTSLSATYNTNLLANPGGECSTNPWVAPGWTMIANPADYLMVAGTNSGTPHSGSNFFVTSYDWMRRCQTNNLLASGYTSAELDLSPAISVGEWVQASSANGNYYIRVELRDASSNIVTTWGGATNTVTAGTTWSNVTYTFTNYGTGVRYVYFEDGGKDVPWWAGNYGIQFDDAYVRLVSAEVLGTNGALIASGEAASAAKGSDFGSLQWGTVLTNTFSITNSGNTDLTISGVTTNGDGAAAFSISDLGFSITAGSASNFTVRFAPSNAGVYTAAVQIANNFTPTNYIVYLAGTLNPAPVQDGWLAVQVTPTDGSWQLTAPVGYTNPTSGTGNLAVVSAVTGQYDISYGALSGYVAPSNQTQFVTGGSTTLFAGVYLQVPTNIGTADITASDMVYLPVNATNLTTAGTVSFRLGNLGPDPLNSAEVAFDFRMGSNNAAMVLLGSDQRAFNLAAGQEQLVILTAQAKRGLVVPAALSGVQQVKVTVRHLSALNDPNPANNTTTGPGTVLVRASGVNSPGRSLNDYDGDGKSDVALCRADKGVWAAILSGTRGYGTTGIEPETGGGRYWTAAGDYDGDGILDYGLYEENSGTWGIQQSSDGLVFSGVFGGVGFRPASADYDGDHKTDPAVYGPVWGYWAGLKSASDYALGEAWVGGADYEPVMADYDGDGLADQMAYREVDGHWAGLLSGENYAPVDGYFGGLGFRAGAADFDGDGLADPVVYREADGIWLILLSSEDYLGTVFELGGPGYVAALGDFDGDGRADPGVYSERGGVWYGWLSGHSYELSTARFGGPGYQPVSE